MRASAAWTSRLVCSSGAVEDGLSLRSGREMEQATWESTWLLGTGHKRSSCSCLSAGTIVQQAGAAPNLADAFPSLGDEEGASPLSWKDTLCAKGRGQVRGSLQI